MNMKEKRSQKKIKKEKKKLKTEASSSDSDGDSEHELFHYASDRVQLMKEVLKTLKLKKIKSLAPSAFKNLDIEEINTMLLEELLGISNKRLKKILDGQTADDASSSSSEDEVGKPIDIISLDDISDDEDFCFVDESPSQKNKKDPKNDKSKNCRKHRIKKEPNAPIIKQEKVKGAKVQPENEKLLSVLELLELQARARAIRSQLALEAENKAKAAAEASKSDSDGDDVAVILESPTSNQIVISSSDESEVPIKNSNTECQHKKGQKIKIVRTRILQDEEKDLEVEQVKKPDDVIENSTIEDIPLPANEVTELNDNVSQLKSQSIYNSPKTDVHKGEAKKVNAVVADEASDSESDVINLDIVEIEGIDD